MGSVEISIIEDNSMVLQTWIESNHSLFSNISKSELFICLDNDSFRVSSVLHSHPISSKWKKNILVFSITLQGAGKYIKLLSSSHIPPPGSTLGPSFSTSSSSSASSLPIITNGSSSNPTTPTSSMMSLPTMPSNISSNAVNNGTNSFISNISSYFSSTSQLPTEGAQYIVIQSIQRSLQRYISNIKSDTIEYNKVIHYRKNEGMHFPTMELQPTNNNSSISNGNHNVNEILIPLIITPPIITTTETIDNNNIPDTPIVNNNNNNNFLTFKNSNSSIRFSSSPNTVEILDSSHIDDSSSNCTDCEDDNESVVSSSLSRQSSSSINHTPLLSGINCIHNLTSHSTSSFKKITPILTSSIGSIRANKSPSSQSQSYPSLPSFSAFVLNNQSTSSVNSNGINPTPPNSVNSSLVSASLLPTSPVSINRSNSQLTTSLPLSSYEDDGLSWKPGSFKLPPSQQHQPQQQDPLLLSFSPPTNIPTFGSSFKSTRSISQSKDLPERTSIQIGETIDGFGSGGICSLYGWDYENKVRFGEPFADTFCIDIEPHPYIKATLTIADGSGHGEEPQKASRLSVLGSNEYIESLPTKEISTTNELMNIVGNSILQAHKRIVDNEYYTSQEIHIEPKGATTFCMGTLCKLKELPISKDRSQTGSPIPILNETTIPNNSNNSINGNSFVEPNLFNGNKNSPPKLSPRVIQSNLASSPEISISPPSNSNLSVTNNSNSSTPPQPPPPPPSTNGQWIFLVGSVGDSKAFRWSCVTGNVTEITNTNSKERNFNDAGGQLGWMYGGDDKFWPIEAREYPSSPREDTKELLMEHRREKSQPHLKNLHFAMALVNPGDRVFITSDGISDNFLNNNQITQRRTHRDEIEFNLTKFLKSQPSESLNSCESMVQAIVSFCIENTQQFRSIQEEMSKCLMKMKEIEKSGVEDISKPDSQYHQLRKLYSKLSNNSRNVKNGKPDHASIVMYEIPKDNIKKEEI